MENLDISEPLGVSNVDPSQLWCIKSNENHCNCTGQRGHIQTDGAPGTIINKKYCMFLKAEFPPTHDGKSSGSLSLTVVTSF